MTASSPSKRVPTHPASGGQPKKTINRLGPVLLAVGVLFVVAWGAWNLWIAAYVAHGGH